MATNIAGMFNMATPEQMRQEYLAANMVSPAQMGQQPLLNQAVSMGRNAGAMIGSSLNQMAGGTVPGEAEASQMDQIVRTIDESNVSLDKKFDLMAAALARMPGTADKVIALRERAAQIRAEAAKQTPTKLPQIVQLQQVRDALPANDPRRAEIQAQIDALGKGSAPESAYSTVVAKGVADKDLSLVQNAETAGESISKIKETLALLEKGDPTTGIGAELLNNVDRVKAQFLNDKKAGKKVTDTQVLDALLGSEVFPMIGALGIGARGLDTPAEREFLRGVFTGTIQMDKNTLIRLTKIRENVAQRAIDKYNQKLKAGELKAFEKAQGRQLKPITTKAFTVSNW